MGINHKRLTCTSMSSISLPYITQLKPMMAEARERGREIDSTHLVLITSDCSCQEKEAEKDGVD